MKNILLIIMLVSVTKTSMGQVSDFRRKIIYAELFGNTINSVSINFENVISEKKNIHFGYRVGLGGLIPEPKTFALPVNVFGFTGKRNSHFEFALGISYLYGTFNRRVFGKIVDYNSSLFAPVNMGYRFQKPEGGLFFRINLNACFEVVEFSGYKASSFIYPSAGFAIGSSL